MSKYAYVVSGSEDGIIGVYSNKADAIKEAENYTLEHGNEHVKTEDYIRDFGDCYVTGTGCSAEVTKWPLC